MHHEFPSVLARHAEESSYFGIEDEYIFLLDEYFAYKKARLNLSPS